MSPSHYDHEGRSRFYGVNKVLLPGQGNNAFSLEKMPDRQDLRITPLQKGFIAEAQMGTHVAFQDFDGESWLECTGLQYAVCEMVGNIPVYLFDNHNHAFFGWLEAFHSGSFRKGASLVHMDAHFDDASPDHYDVDLSDLESVWKYTHETLQIASFITPALHHGVFSQCVNYVESGDFEYLMPLNSKTDIVLDLDLDVFCDEMSHVTWSQKIEVLKYYWPQTRCVTMATSPFFIDQQRAIDIAKRLMEEVFIPLSA